MRDALCFNFNPNNSFNRLRERSFRAIASIFIQVKLSRIFHLNPLVGKKLDIA